jgi:hypothetical protein
MSAEEDKEGRDGKGGAARVWAGTMMELSTVGRVLFRHREEVRRESEDQNNVVTKSL